MPRYFFHICGHVECPDCEGRDLADDSMARAEAIKGLREIAAEDLKTGRLDLHDRIIVESEDGSTVATVWLKDVVHIGKAPIG